MLIAEAETRLVAMLASAGVRPGAVTAADVRGIFDAYQRFATIRVDDAAPVEEEGDAVLAQFGTHDFRGVSEFSADLTRQMVAKGRDPQMWQLSCTPYLLGHGPRDRRAYPRRSLEFRHATR